MALAAGATGEMAYALRQGDLANALAVDAGDVFPPVFSTSRMIALMEICSARLMAPEVPAGRLSVGVGVNVTHLAATPGGESVRAVSIFLGMAGKLHRFKVQIFDRAGLVGEGTHTRAIVDAARLEKGAVARIAGVPG